MAAWCKYLLKSRKERTQCCDTNQKTTAQLHGSVLFDSFAMGAKSLLHFGVLSSFTSDAVSIFIPQIAGKPEGLLLLIGHAVTGELCSLLLHRVLRRVLQSAVAKWCKVWQGCCAGHGLKIWQLRALPCRLLQRSAQSAVEGAGRRAVVRGVQSAVQWRSLARTLCKAISFPD